MNLCSRCKKRMAVIFVTRMENGTSQNEGLCIKCAKELGIGPVNDMLAKMGIDDEQIERMDEEMQGLIPMDDMSEEEIAELEAGEGDDGRAPAIDFGKLFGGMNGPLGSFFGATGAASDKDAEKSKADKREEKKRDKKKKYLSSYCVDLTKKAHDGALDDVIGRERELARLLQILLRRQKNNPCLIGEPGVGKTAVAEALAQKIARGEVPYRLKDKEVHLLDLTALVAGTQFRGQFESRMKGLIEEVKGLGNVILVIDEVHTLASAGDAEGSMSAANILKPALSRGEIQVIGATTLTEYRKYIERDAALERRFQPILIDEPSMEEAETILCGIKGYYENFHGITIPNDAVHRAVIMSELYITDRFLPDEAIDLLDEASAYVALHAPVIDELKRLEATVAMENAEREALEHAEATENEEENNARYARLAELKSLALKNEAQLAKLQEERAKVSLDTEALAHVIEIWTGIPASSITEHEFTRLSQLGDRLRARIVGQDEAVDAVVRAIKRNRTGVSYKKKPVSFLFAGPTGVGKTELVKTLARELFQSPDALIRLDMSEYMEKYAVSRIIGSPPGYIGYDDAGQLTEKIRRKPYSVVLFDEIEKAHPDVLNILLQILDDGRLTDAHGKEVNFENTVIVMTTNAGSTSNDNTAGFAVSTKAAGESRTEKALLTFLRPEFINRIDEIVTFRSLDENDFVSIAKIMIGELVSALSEKEMRLCYTEGVLACIARESFTRTYGAPNMRRYSQTHIEDAIANRIIDGYQDGVSVITLDVTKDEEGKEQLDIRVSGKNR